MVSIWLTKVKSCAKLADMKKSASQSEADFHQIPWLEKKNCFTDDIAGCGWCAGPPGRAGRSRTARRGTRRQSACSGCKPPRGRADRRELQRQLRPYGE